MKLTEEDFKSSLTEPQRSLTDEENNQILENQEKLEKIKELTQENHYNTNLILRDKLKKILE